MTNDEQGKDCDNLACQPDEREREERQLTPGQDSGRQRASRKLIRTGERRERERERGQSEYGEYERHVKHPVLPPPHYNPIQH